MQNTSGESAATPVARGAEPILSKDLTLQKAAELGLAQMGEPRNFISGDSSAVELKNARMGIGIGAGASGAGSKGKGEGGTLEGGRCLAFGDQEDGRPSRSTEVRMMKERM